jgi:RNA polymerase sigma-70 factor (ECF subfamily)
MSEPSLAVLLEKLCSGDMKAAEEVFRTYEPILRSVVRRHLGPDLQAGFDSVDVVQSIWVDLLQGFRSAGWCFTDAEHLKAFLVKATRNRFLDKARRQRSARQYEELARGKELDPIGPTALPRPSEVVQAEDLWELLLSHCLPAHRDILLLKRQGLSVPEIAARTGWHEDSIWRILRNLASRLALQQERKG